MDRFDELAIFVAILEAGSLNGAARRLRKSAPAVTRALNALEERVGVRLIERTTRRLAATGAGLRLAEMARRVLADYEDALGEEEHGPLRGRLRITAPHVFGRRHVTPAMIAFLDLHPALQIEIVFNDRNMDLIEHGLDLALRIGRLPDAGLVARRVGEVRRLLVASPAYLARRAAPRHPLELEQHDLVYSSLRDGPAEWRFAHNGQESALPLAPRLTINEVDAMLMAVQAGRGIGRCLSYQVAEQLADGTLVRLLPAFEPDALPVQVVVQSARHMPRRLRACFDYLADQLSGLPVLGPMA